MERDSGRPHWDKINRPFFNSKGFKVAVAFVFVILCVVLLQSSVVEESLSPPAIRAFIEGYGASAPMMYMIVYAVLIVFFFPASVLSAIGGFIFGPFWGTIYTILAATVAASLAFLLARYLGKEFVQARLGGTLKTMESKISDDGFWSMVILRLLFLPYIPLSYAAGLTRMSLWDFTLATFLTDIPGSFAFTYLGSSITEPKNLIVAILVIAALMCIPVLVKRYQSRRSQKK